MRVLRLLLLAVPLVACAKITIVDPGGGGGDGGGGGGGNDGSLTGKDGGTPSGDMAVNGITVAATATASDQPTGGTPKYLPLAGVGVALDATGTVDTKAQSLTYAWSLVSSPTASTATVQNANSIKASFVPDLGGDYVINVTVTATDSRTASKSITVTATTVALFYTDVQLVSGTSNGATQMLMRSDGGGKLALSCPRDTGPGDNDAPIITDAYGTIFAQAAGYPLPDPTSGVQAAARYLFAVSDPRTDMSGSSDDNNFLWHYAVADETSTCAGTQPKDVPKPIVGNALAPSWSPDLTRFVYPVDVSDTVGTQLAIATDTEATPISGLDSLYIAPVSPVWIGATSIAFIVFDNHATNAAMKIYKATLTGSVASDVGIWADCSSVSSMWNITTMEARGASVFLNIGAGSGTIGSDIWQLTPGSTQSCTGVNLTESPSGNGANDFDVSPDGKWLVYTRLEQASTDLAGSNNGPGALDVYLVDVTKPGTGVLLGGAPGAVNFGPKFIAGGRQIEFFSGPPATLFANHVDMGGATLTWKGITVVNLDGSNPRSLLGGSLTLSIDGDGAPTSFSGGLIGANYSFFGGCNVDPFGSPLSSVLTGLVVAAALLFVARRRRDRRA